MKFLLPKLAAVSDFEAYRVNLPISSEQPAQPSLAENPSCC